MAENQAIEPIERVLDNANISSWQSGLAGAINDTYSYKINSHFYAMLPAYYRDYAWRYIRPACQWMDGYVPSIHQTSGIISTRLAGKLISGLTKQIVGEKIVFKVNDCEAVDVHDQLHFVSEWSTKQNIIKAIYGAVGFALGIGTSILKANKTADQQIWWEAVRFDRCFYMATFKNEVEEATFVIKGYEDTKTDSNTSFFLVEHRFYQTYDKGLIEKQANGGYKVIRKVGERVPMVEYNVVRVTGTMQNNVMPDKCTRSNVNWQELPKNLRKAIKSDYAVIKIDTPQELGLENLGVEPLLNGEIDLAVPTGTNFGESMVVGIQDDLITYELASSYLIRDMYLGKGTVYVPKSLNMGDIGITAEETYTGGVLNSIPDSAIELMKGVNPDEQKIVTQQFEIRAGEWQTIKENCLKNIAVKWGMSPKILANFLTMGQAAMTATQIDSEDDACIAFIAHTRAYFLNTLNKLLDTTMHFYGFNTNITLDFASPTLISKDRIINRTMTKLQAGLIDLEDAIREINPDLDEEAIQNKINKANAQRQMMMQQQIEEMNSEGNFGEEDGTTI